MMILMKKQYILYLLLCFLLTNCGNSDDDNEGLSLSTTAFESVSYKECTLELQINTSQAWTATSWATWCVPLQEEGTGNTVLKLQLQSNVSGKSRTGKVTIWTKEVQYDVTITQEAIPEGEEFHYQLPVIFHVFYENANDPKQYIDAVHLAKLIEEVNSCYKGSVLYNGGESGIDMNLEFVLATKDENGNELQMPGVEYVKVPSVTINCMSMMSDKYYKKYLWDLNKYINVMLYHFATEPGSNSVILGVSHLPLTVKGTNQLAGLGIVEQSYMTNENLGYPMCVSLNSQYAYENSKEGYNGFDFKVTTAHELGHYLGLHHAFDEDESGELSAQCIDSDYCEDTPSYNRNAYMMELAAKLKEAAASGKPADMTDLVIRENCKTGLSFSSFNVMDYEVTYADRFTPDQRKRIRNVLMYSPLRPGPKIYPDGVSTRAVAGELELPMIIRQ